MRALAIVHQRDAGPGVFADAFRSRGVELDSWLRAETESPPRNQSDYDAVLIFGGAMHADAEPLDRLLERGGRRRTGPAGLTSPLGSWLGSRVDDP